MTIKITIEVDSENEQQFEELQRHIRSMTKSVCDRYPAVTHHVSESFIKEGREVADEVKPGRWPRLRDIILPSRADADEVVEYLRHVLRKQGFVTVADLLKEVGKTSELADTK